MKIEKFKCVVININYCQLELEKMSSKIFYSKCEIESWENCKGDSIEKDVYLAKLSTFERKQGKPKRQKFLNLNVYLTEAEYNERIIEVGDILEITNGKLATDSTELILRDKAKLKNFPANKIKRDENGYLVGKFKVTTCKISVPIGGFQIVEKDGESFYFTIDCNKFFTDTKSNLMYDETFSFGLSEDEYEAIKDWNEQTMIMRCYAHKQSVGKWNAFIKVTKDTETEHYVLDITRLNKVVKGENGTE